MDVGDVMTKYRGSSRWRTAGITAVVVVIVCGAVTALALFLAPVVLPNLQTSVVDADRTERVTGASGTVSLMVPAGWSVQRESEDASHIVVRTPDALLAITVDLTAGDPVTAVRDAAIEGLGSPHLETVSTGARLAHAEAPDALVAAIAGVDDRVSGRFVVRPAEDVDLGAYRAEIARLLDAVRIES